MAHCPKMQGKVAIFPKYSFSLEISSFSKLAVFHSLLSNVQSNRGRLRNKLDWAGPHSSSKYNPKLEYSIDQNFVPKFCVSNKISNLTCPQPDLTCPNLTWPDFIWHALNCLALYWLHLTRPDLTRSAWAWSDLSLLDLSWLKLSWLDLSRLDLTQVNLYRLDLSWLDLFQIHLS